MSQGSTVGGVQVADLQEALRKLGADPIALSASVGLPAPPRAGPGARVPAILTRDLLDAAARELGDPLVGLHAGARVETRGPLFYLLLSSPRVSEGLRLFASFTRVAFDALETEVIVRQGIVDLTVDLSDPEIAKSHHTFDYILGSHLSSLRRAIAGFRLLEVTLVHDEVGAPGEAARTFGCPVRFGCRRNALRFPDSTLDRAGAAANAAIADQMQKYISTLSTQIAPRSAQDRVADAIRVLIAAGLPSDRAAVARRLHVSERTLQRQLEQESTTFKLLQDGVRSELSQALLSNPRLKVEVIAHSVGFAEGASFSRAFTRWSGHSPTRYREQLDRKVATVAYGVSPVTGVAAREASSAGAGDHPPPSALSSHL